MNIIEYIFIDVIIVLLGMYFYRKYDGRVIYSIPMMYRDLIVDYINSDASKSERINLRLVNVSFIILLSSTALLCIFAFFIVLASKDQDFDKLDILRKFKIVEMLFYMNGLIMTALIMIAIMQEK